MSLSQFLVTACGAGVIAALARFFFRARQGTTVELTTAGREATVVVLGGYQPNLVRADRRAAAALTFDPPVTLEVVRPPALGQADDDEGVAGSHELGHSTEPPFGVHVVRRRHGHHDVERAGRRGGASTSSTSPTDFRAPIPFRAADTQRRAHAGFAKASGGRDSVTP